MRIVGILVSALIAVALYGLLRRKPPAYGLIEILMGLVAVYFYFYPQYYEMTTEPSSVLGELTQGIVINLVGGIYLIVQGLDHMLGRSRRAP